MILQCLQINWNVFRSFSVCAFNLLNFYLLLSLVLRFVIPFHVRSAWKIELFWFNRDFRLDGESLRSESASHHRIKLFCVRLARLSFIQQHIVRHETMTWNWNFDKIDRLMADFISLSFAMQICNPWFSRQFGLFRLFFFFSFCATFSLSFPFSDYEIGNLFFSYFTFKTGTMVSQMQLHFSASQLCSDFTVMVSRLARTIL